MTRSDVPSDEHTQKNVAALLVDCKLLAVFAGQVDAWGSAAPHHQHAHAACGSGVSTQLLRNHRDLYESLAKLMHHADRILLSSFQLPSNAFAPCVPDATGSELAPRCWTGGHNCAL